MAPGENEFDSPDLLCSLTDFKLSDIGNNVSLIRHCIFSTCQNACPTLSTNKKSIKKPLKSLMNFLTLFPTLFLLYFNHSFFYLKYIRTCTTSESLYLLLPSPKPSSPKYVFFKYFIEFTRVTVVYKII